MRTGVFSSRQTNIWYHFLTSTVGLPLESRISLASTAEMVEEESPDAILRQGFDLPADWEFPMLNVGWDTKAVAFPVKIGKRVNWVFRKIISTRYQILLQRSSVCEPNGALGSLSKMLTSKEKVCEKCVLLEHDLCVSYLLCYEAGGRMRWSEINGRKRFPSCLLASVLTV